MAPTPRKSKNGGGTPSGGSLFSTLSLISATHGDDDGSLAVDAAGEEFKKL